MSDEIQDSPIFQDDVREYHRLKAQEKMIKARLEVLRPRILAKYDPGQTTHNEYTVSVELRRSTPQIDHGVLWEIIREKNLYDELVVEAIDHGAVKQAFIDGLITDDDLRAFNLGSKITPALSIKLTEEEDTEGNEDLPTMQEG